MPEQRPHTPLFPDQELTRQVEPASSTPELDKLITVGEIFKERTKALRLFDSNPTLILMYLQQEVAKAITEDETDHHTLKEILYFLVDVTEIGDFHLSVSFIQTLLDLLYSVPLTLFTKEQQQVLLSIARITSDYMFREEQPIYHTLMAIAFTRVGLPIMSLNQLAQIEHSEYFTGQAVLSCIGLAAKYRATDTVEALLKSKFDGELPAAGMPDCLKTLAYYNCLDEAIILNEIFTTQERSKHTPSDQWLDNGLQPSLAYIPEFIDTLAENRYYQTAYSELTYAGLPLSTELGITLLRSENKQVTNADPLDSICLREIIDDAFTNLVEADINFEEKISLAVLLFPYKDEAALLEILYDALPPEQLGRFSDQELIVLITETSQLQYDTKNKLKHELCLTFARHIESSYSTAQLLIQLLQSGEVELVKSIASEHLVSSGCTNQELLRICSEVLIDLDAVDTCEPVEKLFLLTGFESLSRTLLPDGQLAGWAELFFMAQDRYMENLMLLFDSTVKELLSTSPTHSQEKKAYIHLLTLVSIIDKDAETWKSNLLDILRSSPFDEHTTNDSELAIICHELEFLQHTYGWIELKPYIHSLQRNPRLQETQLELDSDHPYFQHFLLLISQQGRLTDYNQSFALQDCQTFCDKYLSFLLRLEGNDDQLKLIIQFYIEQHPESLDTIARLCILESRCVLVSDHLNELSDSYYQDLELTAIFTSPHTQDQINYIFSRLIKLGNFNCLRQLSSEYHNKVVAAVAANTGDRVELIRNMTSQVRSVSSFLALCVQAGMFEQVKAAVTQDQILDAVLTGIWDLDSSYFMSLIDHLPSLSYEQLYSVLTCNAATLAQKNLSIYIQKSKGTLDMQVTEEELLAAEQQLADGPYSLAQIHTTLNHLNYDYHQTPVQLRKFIREPLEDDRFLQEYSYSSRENLLCEYQQLLPPSLLEMIKQEDFPLSFLYEIWYTNSPNHQQVFFRNILTYHYLLKLKESGAAIDPTKLIHPKHIYNFGRYSVDFLNSQLEKNRPKKQIVLLMPLTDHNGATYAQPQLLDDIKKQAEAHDHGVTVIETDNPVTTVALLDQIVQENQGESIKGLILFPHGLEGELNFYHTGKGTVLAKDLINQHVYKKHDESWSQFKLRVAATLPQATGDPDYSHLKMVQRFSLRNKLLTLLVKGLPAEDGGKPALLDPKCVVTYFSCFAGVDEGMSEASSQLTAGVHLGADNASFPVQCHLLFDDSNNLLSIATEFYKAETMVYVRGMFRPELQEQFRSLLLGQVTPQEVSTLLSKVVAEGS